MDVPFYLQRPVEDNNAFTPRATWSTGYNENARLKFAENFKANMEHIANAQIAPSKQRPGSWMDNINYENGYDASIEDRFRAEHKYLELADYLSHFKMDNISDQRSYENEISQLRRYGRQYNAVHGKASSEESDAITFLEAFDSGDIGGLDPTRNKTKGSYDGAISLLGRKEYTNSPLIPSSLAPAPIKTEYGNDEAASITVSFNNKHVSYGLWGLGFDWMSKDVDEDQFDKFAKDTGYDVGTIRNLLGEHAVTYDVDGKAMISIPKTNLDGIKILTQVRKWCNETGRTVDDVQYASYGPHQRLINDNTVEIGSQIQRLSDLLDRANTRKNNVMSSIGGGQQIVSTTVLPYMNERQMQLKQLVNAGVIDDTKYNSMLKADNEIYQNLLLATDFSQLDVYTTDKNENPNDRTLRRMDDNLERGGLKDYINNAISEDRVSWRAGISGGEYGTYIEVNAVDNKGKRITDKDDYRRGMTIFIPGLFTESIQQAFNASTQGKTVAEINSMQQYGYEYTLQNGDILSNVGNNGARLYNKDTKTYRDISREEAQNVLHRDIIVEDATMKIRNRALTNDGKRRAGYNPETDAKKIAIAAANELYPGRPVEEYDVAAWNPSKEDAARRRSEGDIYLDDKASKTFSIYTQIMNNIYRLLNINKK